VPEFVTRSDEARQRQGSVTYFSILFFIIQLVNFPLAWHGACFVGGTRRAIPAYRFLQPTAGGYR
jgi:hypothetical protein